MTQPLWRRFATEQTLADDLAALAATKADVDPVDVLEQKVAELTLAVTALQQGGTGPIVIGNTVPSVIRDLIVTPTTTTLAGSWTVPESTGGTAITGYRVTLTLSGAAVSTAVKAVGVLSHSFTGLTAGTGYSYSVSAINAVGDSTPVALTATTLNTATVPGADKPTATVTAVTDTSITLDWAAPTTPAQAIVGYRFGFDSADSRATPMNYTTADLTSPADPFVFTNADPDITYTAWVEARYAGPGGSAPTAIASDTFTGTNGSAPSTSNVIAGFTPSGGGLAIQGNKMRMTSGSGGGYSAAQRIVAIWRNGAGVNTSIADATWHYSGQTVPAGDARLALFARASATNDVFPNSYLLELADGVTPTAIRIASNATTSMGVATGLTASTATPLDVDIRTVGGTVQMWIWPTGGTRPTAPQINFTDSAPLSAGYAGAQLSVGGAAVAYAADLDGWSYDNGSLSGASTIAGTRTTVSVKTSPAPINPPATASGLPTGRIAAIYHWCWSGPDIATIDSHGPHTINLYYGFVAQSAGSGTGAVGFSPNSAGTFAAQKAALPANTPYLCTIGGAQDGGIVITNSTQVTQFVNSMKTIITQWGLNGIDWDLESDGYNPASLVSASNQLRTWYEGTFRPGQKFIVSFVPRPWETAPFQAAQSLGANLDIFGMQFYDSPEYSNFSQGQGYVRQYVAKCISYGIPASKVLLGFIALPYGNGGVSNALATQYYNDIKSLYPTIRGVFVYDSNWEANSTGWALTNGLAATVRAS